MSPTIYTSWKIYPDSRHPHVKCFENFKERFEKTAYANYEKSTRVENVWIEENELKITWSVMASRESIVREIHVGKSSVVGLKNNRFHHFHVKIHQDLIFLPMGA